MGQERENVFMGERYRLARALIVHVDSILNGHDGLVVIEAKFDLVAALESANAHG
jgi:hypothetical protein